jgi:hypothetical protein
MVKSFSLMLLFFAAVAGRRHVARVDHISGIGQSMEDRPLGRGRYALI